MRLAKVDFTVRMMAGGETDFACRVDRLSHASPWTARDFTAARRAPGSVLACAVLPQDEEHGEFVGFIVGLLTGESLSIPRLGVHPEWQRCGIGTGLGGFLLRQYAGQFSRVYVDVPVTSGAHECFWGHLGFAPTSTPGVFFKYF